MRRRRRHWLSPEFREFNDRKADINATAIRLRCWINTMEFVHANARSLDFVRPRNRGTSNQQSPSKSRTINSIMELIEKHAVVNQFSSKEIKKRMNSACIFDIVYFRFACNVKHECETCSESGAIHIIFHLHFGRNNCRYINCLPPTSHMQLNVWSGGRGISCWMIFPPDLSRFSILRAFQY